MPTGFFYIDVAARCKFFNYIFVLKNSSQKRSKILIEIVVVYFKNFNEGDVTTS